MDIHFFLALALFCVGIAFLVRIYLLLLVAQRYLEKRTRLVEMEITKREFSEQA